MTQYLNFSSNYYKNIAQQKETANYENNNTAADAFMLCIKNLEYNELDNLCNKIKKYYQSKENPIYLSLDDSYKLTQGQNITDDKNFKQTILNLAYDCLKENLTMGTKTQVDAVRKTSTWINHCLYQGEAAANLAKAIGLNPDTARKLGILHDIGRKKTHTLLHTILGYETLIDENWYDEAIICLTHSFISNQEAKKGGRCCSCDPPLPGFYVDEQGNPQWKENTTKDDMTLFLEHYTYNKYDSIINIADLMAKSNGIVSPYQRTLDIATRTAPNPINNNYFKAEFINLMNNYLQQTEENIQNKKIKATSEITDEQMNDIYYDTSNTFYEHYNKICN